MAKTRSLNVVISGDARGLNKAFDQVDDHAHKSERGMRRFSGVASAAFVGIGGAAVAGLGASAKAAIDAEAAMAKVRTMVEKSGISWKEHAKQIDTVIQKQSQLSGFDDEELSESFANMLRLTGDLTKAFKLNALVMDVARTRGQTLAGSASLIARVYNGNYQGVKRLGVALDEHANRQEALAALQKAFAGQAQAYGKTTAGSLDRSRVAAENLGETVGQSLAPTITKASNAFASFVNWTQRNRTASHALFITLGSLTAAVTALLVAAKVAQAFKTLRIATLAYAVAARAAAVATRILTVAQIALNVALRANPIGAVVTALTALGVGLVIAYKRSQTFRNIVDGAFSAVKDNAKTLTTILTTVLFPSFRLMLKLARGVSDAVRSIGRAFGSLKDAAGSIPIIGGALKKLGDGVGKVADSYKGGLGSLPSRGGNVTGLMGAQVALGPVAAIGSRFGLHVSSGRRPGSITSSGNVSYHSSGEAVDESDGTPGPSPAKLRFFNYMKSRFGRRLAELIYTPGGVGIKNGQPFRYTGAVAAQHYDHVHVAIDTGRPGVGDGIGKRLRRFMGDGSGRSYSGPELARLWVRAGGPKNVAGLMARVALAESGGNPRAHNPSGATGLWQILGAVRPGDLYDPLVNARNAVAKYKAGGLHPWDASRSVWGKYVGRSGISVGKGGYKGSGYEEDQYYGQAHSGNRPGAAGSTGGQSISEMVADAADRARQVVRNRGGTSIAPPTWSQRFADADLAIAISQGGSVQDQIGALTKQRLLIGERIKRVRSLLARKGARALSRADRLKYTQELGTLLGSDRSAAESLFGLAAGRAGETPEAPSELDWLQAAAAEAGLTPDKADDIAAATGIRDLRARQLQFARAAGDPRGVAEFASALKDAQDALDGLTGSAQDAENAMKEHTDALNAVATELKRQTDFAQTVQATESWQIKRALADVLSGAIAGRGIARSYAPGFGVEARY